VKHDIDAVDRRAGDVGITQVSTEELDVRGDRAEIGLLPGAQIIDDSNRVTALNQLSCDVRANEPGSACHQAASGLLVFFRAHGDLECKASAVTQVSQVIYGMCGNSP
jgi:hypothetical protein